MADVYTWDPLADNNNQPAPDGFPEGMTPSSVNNAAREIMAAVSRLHRDLSGSILSTGTATAYAISVNQNVATLAVGHTFAFRAHVDNDAGAVTINVNGLGATALIGGADSAELPARTLREGGVYTIAHNGTEFVIEATFLPEPAPNLIAYPYTGALDQRSETWNKPAGLKRVKVTATGGGGGGCFASSIRYGGGGASSATAVATFDADDLPDTVPLLIGKGGDAGVVVPVGATGQDGFATSFGTLVVVPGGGGGGSALSAPFDPGLATVPTIDASAVSSITYPGMPGQAGTDVGSDFVAPSGGFSLYGGARAAVVQNGTALLNDGNATSYGAGGGGSARTGTFEGFAGFGGLLLIEEFF